VTTYEIKPEVPVHGPPRLEFEAVYRDNVRQVTAFFARRCRDPQQVADLTSQTFVEAIRSAATYQGRGSPRAWLIAIARRVYAHHVADQVIGADLIDQLGGRLELADDELEDLAERIDAQRDGRRLLERTAGMSSLERGDRARGPDRADAQGGGERARRLTERAPGAPVPRTRTTTKGVRR
jgi:DNA-directed RNA polymerase specialized sigma24 family protein